MQCVSGTIPEKKMMENQVYKYSTMQTETIIFFKRRALKFIQNKLVYGLKGLKFLSKVTEKITNITNRSLVSEHKEKLVYLGRSILLYI